MLPDEANKALPINAPNMACVVEIGKPKSEAKITVNPAPPATAIINGIDCIISAGAIPLPENLSNKAFAKNIAKQDPAKVVIVAQPKAFLKLNVPLPNKVATPLKLSFAPLAKAKNATKINKQYDSILILRWSSIGFYIRIDTLIFVLA